LRPRPACWTGSGPCSGAGRSRFKLLRRETTAKRKQADWNDSYPLKVLSNLNAIALVADPALFQSR